MKKFLSRLGRGRLAIAGWLVLGGVAGAVAQDVMLQDLPFIHVEAEDAKVRVLRFAAPAVTHRDEAIDPVEAVLVEIKQ